MRSLLLTFALVAASSVAFAQAAPSAASQAPQLTIELSTTGAEPRVPLRYSLSEVAAQRTQMDMDMTIGMGFGGQTFDQTMPTMRTNIAITDPTLNSDGNLRIGFVVEEMTVVPGTGGADAMVAAQLEAALADVGQFSGTLTMDDRGNIVSSEYDLSEVSPAIRQQMESTMQTVQQSVIPFPEEAVGVGARWSVDMGVEMSGMSLSQVATYEVVEISESSVRITSTIAQSAEAQTLELPDLPPGATAELLSYSGSGTGGMTIDFSQAMPEGSFSIQNSTRIRSGDAASGMTMDMDMNLSMTARMTTVTE